MEKKGIKTEGRGGRGRKGEGECEREGRRKGGRERKKKGKRKHRREEKRERGWRDGGGRRDRNKEQGQGQCSLHSDTSLRS